MGKLKRCTRWVSNSAFLCSVLRTDWSRHFNQEDIWVQNQIKLSNTIAWTMASETFSISSELVNIENSRRWIQVVFCLAEMKGYATWGFNSQHLHCQGQSAQQAWIQMRRLCVQMTSGSPHDSMCDQCVCLRKVDSKGYSRWGSNSQPQHCSAGYRCISKIR